MFSPIATERLVLRQVRRDDATSLAARRSDPSTAEYQSWTIPYPLESARELIEAVLAMEGPASDEWYMIAIADAGSGAMIGDLALRLTWQGRTAEIGYNLDPDVRGNGYATEAVAALVAYLFEDLAVTRVEASLHPDNLASAFVLERTGFIYEARTRSDYWSDDVVSDTDRYGLLREDHERWISRPRTAPERVELVEVGPGGGRDVIGLRTHHTQRRFVAPMENSFADALFPEVFDGGQVTPWLRAVTADDEIVGFVMLALSSEHHPEPYLWRFLIDRLHQRRGIGRRVLDLVVAQCRAWGDTTLLTSWEVGRGSPEPFYLSYGFERTGRIVEGETEGRLVIEDDA